jgi:hypothetical protein
MNDLLSGRDKGPVYKPVINSPKKDYEEIRVMPEEIYQPPK